ncbi:hypothetical protein [Sandaracinus amylolyticus]|uniref:hypothetical protein n=1 Tax=Sandaracinus amylolyticus TaxID=927083 RepID=UPI001F3A85C6|nr:hypothetical protein [Sandaracinus amylolyticus]
MVALAAAAWLVGREVDAAAAGRDARSVGTWLGAGAVIASLGAPLSYFARFDDLMLAQSLAAFALLGSATGYTASRWRALQDHPWTMISLASAASLLASGYAFRWYWVTTDGPTVLFSCAAMVLATMTIAARISHRRRQRGERTRDDR